MKPIIGINCDYEGDTKSHSFVYRDYVDAIIMAGGIPFLLPLIKNRDDVKCLLERMDGLLLTGGDDVPPARYGEERREKTYCVHADKDVFDNLLLQLALEKQKPILALCYGAQLINVAYGGSLIQDVPSEVKTAISHKPAKGEKCSHSVSIEKNTLLHKIIGADALDTNSAHHQAVKRLGKGLKATARASDGIIEAFECEGYPFLVAVQWHPERLTIDTRHAALFKALVGASSRP